MADAEQIRQEIAKLAKTKFPKTPVTQVRVEESSDSAGQPSVNIRIVFKTRPPKHDMRYGKNSLVDEFRTWLSTRGDERFPYFSFVTEKDEKELSKLN